MAWVFIFNIYIGMIYFQKLLQSFLLYKNCNLNCGSGGYAPGCSVQATLVLERGF